MSVELIFTWAAGQAINWAAGQALRSYFAWDFLEKWLPFDAVFDFLLSSSSDVYTRFSGETSSSILFQPSSYVLTSRAKQVMCILLVCYFLRHRIFKCMRFPFCCGCCRRCRRPAPFSTRQREQQQQQRSRGKSTRSRTHDRNRFTTTRQSDDETTLGVTESRLRKARVLTTTTTFEPFGSRFPCPAGFETLNKEYDLAANESQIDKTCDDRNTSHNDDDDERKQKTTRIKTRRTEEPEDHVVVDSGSVHDRNTSLSASLWNMAKKENSSGASEANDDDATVFSASHASPTIASTKTWRRAPTPASMQIHVTTHVNNSLPALHIPLENLLPTPPDYHTSDRFAGESTTVHSLSRRSPSQQEKKDNVRPLEHQDSVQDDVEHQTDQHEDRTDDANPVQQEKNDSTQAHSNVLTLSSAPLLSLWPSLPNILDTISINDEQGSSSPRQHQPQQLFMCCLHDPTWSHHSLLLMQELYKKCGLDSSGIQVSPPMLRLFGSCGPPTENVIKNIQRTIPAFVIRIKESTNISDYIYDPQQFAQDLNCSQTSSMVESSSSPPLQQSSSESSSSTQSLDQASGDFKTDMDVEQQQHHSEVGVAAATKEMGTVNGHDAVDPEQIVTVQLPIEELLAPEYQRIPWLRAVLMKMFGSQMHPFYLAWNQRPPAIQLFDMPRKYVVQFSQEILRLGKITRFYYLDQLFWEPMVDSDTASSNVRMTIVPLDHK
jgi:hypothetical protein